MATTVHDDTPLDTDLHLHIDHVNAPRGALPEEEGGELALVGVPPEFDLPEHAEPTQRDLEGPDPQPNTLTNNPATSVPGTDEVTDDAGEVVEPASTETAVSADEDDAAADKPKPRRTRKAT